MIKCKTGFWDEQLPSNFDNDMLLEKAINNIIIKENIDEESIVNIWHDITDGAMNGVNQKEPEWYRNITITIFYKG